MQSKYKAFEKEKKLIVVMIKKYCKKKHYKKNTCSECEELIKYALTRLEKCPFKKNKGFCSFCKIHCYQEQMRIKIKRVMKYCGPRMIFSHPIYSLKHVILMIK